MVTGDGLGDVVSSCVERLAVIAAPRGGLITASTAEAFLCSNHPFPALQLNLKVRDVFKTKDVELSGCR